MASQRRTLPLNLRIETRTAALMLAKVQAEGDTAAYTGLQSWIGDLVHITVCSSFEETFGITIRDFMDRIRTREDFPSDDELASTAGILSDLHFAALGRPQGANRAGRAASSRRQRGRFKRGQS